MTENRDKNNVSVRFREKLCVSKTFEVVGVYWLKNQMTYEMYLLYNFEMVHKVKFPETPQKAAFRV